MISFQSNRHKPSNRNHSQNLIIHLPINPPSIPAQNTNNNNKRTVAAMVSLFQEEQTASYEEAGGKRIRSAGPNQGTPSKNI
jgi:hypothetical protein